MTLDSKIFELNNPFACLDDEASVVCITNNDTDSYSRAIPAVGSNTNNCSRAMGSNTNNKNVSRNKNNLTYADRINAIEQYFGVSNICAIYLYHRRRRGIPWKNRGDPKYLEWNMQLQNAIISLDTIIGFDWPSLEFGLEEIAFLKNNININSMPTKPVIIDADANSSDIDGFTKVMYSKKDIAKELNKMGLLPKKYIF